MRKRTLVDETTWNGHPSATWKIDETGTKNDGHLWYLYWKNKTPEKYVIEAPCAIYIHTDTRPKRLRRP